MRPPHLALCLKASLLTLGGLAAGCATVGPSAPSALEASGAALAVRNLRDPGLGNFLVRNLGRDPRPADRVAWDFNTLTWVAFYFHPDVDLARAQWEAARAAQSTASARPNPTLTLTPGFTANSGADSPWFPAIAADLPFETGGKRAARTDAAKLGTEAARQDLFAAAWKIRAELRQALIALHAAEMRVAQLYAQEAGQDGIVQLFEQRQQAGAASGTEVANARLAQLQARAAAAEAARQVPLARQRVATALGLPAAALTNIMFTPFLTTALPAENTLATARQISLRSRADVLAALARYDSARARFTAEAAKRYPDLHFGPSYQWDQGASKWSLGVTLELPVFNRNEGPLAEAFAKTRQAAAEFNAVQARVIAEIDRAAAGQAGAAAVLSSLRGFQQQLTQRQRQLEARRAAGSADRLELQQAMIEQAAGELTLLDAQTQVLIATGELEDALQVPFTDFAPLLTVNAEKSP